MSLDTTTAIMRRFAQADARRRGKPRHIAVELKFPVVARPSGEAAPQEAIQGLWRHLGQRGWRPLRDQSSDTLVAAERAEDGTRDVLSSATGYCVIELSSAPEPSIPLLEQRVRTALAPVTEYCAQHGLVLLGHGIHPITAPSPELLTAKGRNLFWDDVFERATPEARVHLFTVTAASQAHVDVAGDEIVDALAVFNGLVPAQIALSANSGVWGGRVDPQYKNVHESFWDRWLPSEDRVGMPAIKPSWLEGYVRLLLDLKPVYVERNGQPIMLPSCRSFAEFSASQRVIGITVDGKQVEIEPREEDLELHLTFCWHNARVSRYCTLENRVNCQQPPEALMAPAALTLGLAEGLEQASELVSRYAWSDLRRARLDAMRRSLQARVGDGPVTALCGEMLAIADAGLRRRGKGEEAYLQPLWGRLRQERCSADEARACFREHGIQGLVEQFAIR